MEDALSGKRDSDWQGREEKIQRLEESVAALKSALDSSRSTYSSGSGGSGGSSENESSRVRELRLRCQVAEVERDRLSEYVKVVTRRAEQGELSSSEAESALREERRKTARLEHMLEKSQAMQRKETPSSASASSQQLQLSRGSAELVSGLEAELKAAKDELERSKRRRQEDLDHFVKMAADTRKIIPEVAEKREAASKR